MYFNTSVIRCVVVLRVGLVCLVCQERVDLRYCMHALNGFYTIRILFVDSFLFFAYLFFFVLTLRQSRTVSISAEGMY